MNIFSANNFLVILFFASSDVICRHICYICRLKIRKSLWHNLWQNACGPKASTNT